MAEVTTYTRVRIDPPFDMLQAQYVQQHFVPHSHDEYGIGVVTQGIGRLVHAFGEERHPRGTIIAISPGLVHSGEAADDDGWSYRMFYMPPVYLARAAEIAGYREGALPWFDRAAITDARISKRLLAIHRALARSPENCTSIIPRLLATLARLVSEHARVWNPAPNVDRAAAHAVRAARAFIDGEYLNSLTIDVVARHVGLSETYLIRAFRRTYGMPPYVYVEQLRVRHARDLIEQGMGISTAALTARFSDQSHLTRRFKRTFGVTPGVFAARIRRSGVRTESFKKAASR